MSPRATLILMLLLIFMALLFMLLLHLLFRRGLLFILLLLPSFTALLYLFTWARPGHLGVRPISARALSFGRPPMP